MAEYLPAQLERAHKPQLERDAPAKKERPPVQHALLSLQARAGNQAVSRMVQRAGEEDELQMKHDSALQREGEEDELQMQHDPALQREGEEDELQMQHDPALQRQEGLEEEDEQVQARHDPALQREGEEDELQMKRDEQEPRVGLEGGPVGGEIEQRIDSMRGAGSTPPEGIRRQMEAATGADLSGVRVHEGADADTLNNQLTAKAFTTGNDIFLRGDQNPGDGNLMAHEMAHVVQQSSGRTASSGEMSAGAANDPLEAEADSLAHAVLSGQAQRETEEARA